MQWYEILSMVIGGLLGLYICFLLVISLEYPQRQYTLPLIKANVQNIVPSWSEVPLVAVSMEA